MIATINQIRKAISYDNAMLKNYPKREVLYFCRDWTRKQRVLNQLASDIYYDFCRSKNAVGCFEIYDILINKEIPEDIIQFFVDNRCGGCYELDLIFFAYGIGNSNHDTLESVKNDMLSTYKGDMKKINKIFNGKAIKPTLENILQDFSVSGESSIFYKLLAS